MAELNLIPYGLKKKKSDKIKTKDIIAWLVLFGCIAFSAIYFPLLNLSSLHQSEASLKAEVDSYAPVAAETKKLNNEIATVKNHIQTVDSLVNDRVVSNTVIQGLEAYIPSDVAITNLSYSKDTINIAAKSANYNSLCIFAANLQLSKDYSTAKLVGINSAQTSGSSFTCNITIGKQEVK